MHAAVSSKREALAEICRRFHVRRLEVFGSATRDQDFDPQRSDADLLIEFEPDADPGFAGFANLKEALEQVLGRPSSECGTGWSTITGQSISTLCGVRCSTSSLN